jgi:L-histidine Nalpha-methyltransferase
MTLRSSSSKIESRAGGGSAVDFASDVAYYLTLNPRQLPSRYFYDALGSTLFEAICLLPWYGVTRAEARLLEAHRDEIFRRLGRVSTIMELGSGSGEKLRALIQGRSPRAGHVAVHLIDVSRAALMTSARALGDIDDLSVVTHEAEYEEGLAAFSRDHHRPGVTLALFLGSNIGNFDRPGAEAILRSVRAVLNEGDALLIGADLVKPERDLLLAYDDPLGVTSAFNLNLLARINRELGGNLDIAGVEHRALWNAQESRVEMHLVATRPQRARIEAIDLDLDLSAGETIWTESSYKYEPDEIVKLVERVGFRGFGQWIAEEERFALTLLRAV